MGAQIAAGAVLGRAGAVARGAVVDPGPAPDSALGPDGPVPGRERVPDGERVPGRERVTDGEPVVDREPVPERGPTAGGAAGEPATDRTAGVEPFEAFYRAQVDRVYRALAVTLGDPHLAREAIDETMARAYAHWRRVRGLDNPGGWAYRVGLNWATSWWRKRRREGSLSEARSEPAGPPPDPAATAARQALARLALPQRAVVGCRVLLDLSIAETAALLGVAEGTVKSRLAVLRAP
jgi:RNA polymerase sigma-70 factor (ECF subfamily)